MTRQPEATKATVVLVEDHPMFRERLAELINKEPDLEVCGEADNIRDGFDLITTTGRAGGDHRYQLARRQRPRVAQESEGRRA